MSNFKPPSTDLCKADLLRAADNTILANGGQGRCSVRFKFTCPNCGTRCTLNEPNTFYDEGECCACGHVSKIERGGFVLFLTTVPVENN